MADDPSPRQRNGKLKIPLPFDGAMKAALEVKVAREEASIATQRNPQSRRRGSAIARLGLENS
jgi:hypothetical protein